MSDFDYGSRPGQDKPERESAPHTGEYQPSWQRWEREAGQKYQPQNLYQRTSYGGGYELERERYARQGEGRAPDTYNQGDIGRRDNTYQYSTNNGWQRENRPERYEWDFGEYNQAFPGQKKRRRRRGPVVAAVAFLCVLSVGLMVLAGYNIVKLVAPGEGLVLNSDSEEELSAPEESAVGEAVVPGEAGEEIVINIALKPPAVETTEPTIGEKMTIPQVARAVRPSVVGILNYQTSVFIEATSEGSGIIISDNGYIVTNAHVVDKAEMIVVVFDDDTEMEATLIGADARTDLAVLRVERTGLIPATLGDSGELEAGETVIAIGNPGGLELAGSVTQGIVSAVNRVMRTPYEVTNYIQTDAAINPGNSGGALCNEYGQVVGINSAKIVAEGYEGISFAIPVTEALPIIEDLIQNGRVTGRVLLGITGEIVSEVIARNKSVPAGVQITSITSDELTKRGVMRGDIITHIDGERILDMADIRGVLQQHKAGDTVMLTLYRQSRATGNTFDVEVPLIADSGT